ncbi:uncharacterized protein HD556DRAFT_1448291 [Suillus plorans]|uniref:Uncharacterized protein n=1 Tax=Suillus plorans TaxID=116603 RepID=A0A9P7AES3_9AGAM|nr:uncharacterized protein HD556DRAFT_1448291 [Suillus plorans]KAG1787963.1 hypothetical protein HD556DRAFT_1448291 [Suillus plorans]
MLTRSWLYPLSAPIYEFSCVYEALVAIADCIQSHGQAFSPYVISDGGKETDELFPISFMQADTSWNMGLVHPAMSDWGRVNHTGLDANNMRRGLLYDHAFASWSTRSTSIKGRSPSKIFDKPAGTASMLSSQHGALHFDDSLAHPSTHSPTQASTSRTSTRTSTCTSAARTTTARTPTARTPTAHTPTACTSAAHASSNVSPVPMFDTPSTSTIPSAPSTSMIPSQPASTAPSRGRCGTGKGKQQGRKGTEAREGPAGAAEGSSTGTSRPSDAPPDSSAAMRKRGFDVLQGKQADGPSKRQVHLHHVLKVNIKPKRIIQSLQQKGGIYELTGTRAWMAIQMMFAQKPGQDTIRREIAHDLEGYYYVILTLAFMFDAPYMLKKVPHPDTASGGEMFHRWLENTIKKEIWHEAVEKQHYLATDAGFAMVDGVLGNDWVNEPIRMMLREMRTVLFIESAPSHSRMLDIIHTALFKIRTDHTLAHLCQPQQMTNEWARAVGGSGFAQSSPMLPALRMNLLYHKDRQDADHNLFARMPCLLMQERKLTPGNSSQYLKGTGGKTADHINVMAAKVVLKELRKEWAS